MSHRASYWLAQVKPGRIKSGAFRVLFHLCDHHNDERNPARACFPSQETLREKTGMANGTLNSALAQMEADGLLRRIRSTIPGTPVRRTYYILGCDFERMDEQTPKSGVSSNSGPPEPATEQTPDLERANSRFEVSKLRPTGEEPVKNLERKNVCAIDAAFDEFWKVYPKPKDRNKSKALFQKAVAAGIEPGLIISAAKEYCRDNAGNGHRYLAYSDNWLKDRRWENQRAATGATTTVSGSDIEEVARMTAEKICAGRFISPTGVSDKMVGIMMDLGLVTIDQLRRIGVAT